MRTIEELIVALEQTGSGCGLISDDWGHWAVSTSGMQNVPMDPPADIDTVFHVKRDEWNRPFAKRSRRTTTNT